MILNCCDGYCDWKGTEYFFAPFKLFQTRIHDQPSLDIYSFDEFQHFSKSLVSLFITSVSTFSISGRFPEINSFLLFHEMKKMAQILQSEQLNDFFNKKTSSFLGNQLLNEEVTIVEQFQEEEIGNLFNYQKKD